MSHQDRGVQPRCPGSGRLAAGHRYPWRKGMAACLECKAWFHQGLLVRSRSTPMDWATLGLIPEHRKKERVG